MKGKSDMRVAT